MTNPIRRAAHYLAWLLLTIPGTGNAETLLGQVVGISDGDTLNLLVNEQQYRVRLTQIDTPEKAQDWGNRARQALADKVFQQNVRVDVEGTDRYGRILGRIYLGMRDINMELVREGHAWAYRQYLTDDNFIDAETGARLARIGLWQQAAPVAPWDWRRGKRTPKAATIHADDTSAPFTCGSKRVCRQMMSCEEARYYLTQCNVNSLDGDGDGTPCEALCR